MTAQPAHDRLDRQPTWRVQAVFDPEGTGSDFAYTIGLHEQGLPELHTWARPTDGDDPGDDWAFSMRDQCGLLNDMAFRLIDGRLRPGDTWTESYDEGHATVAFRVAELGHPDDVDAYGVAPGASTRSCLMPRSTC